MTTLSNIWNRTFLGKTLKNDRPFGVALVIVLASYSVVHLVKLEIFPFYMFAMYSQPEEPKEFYTTVNITGPLNIYSDNGDKNTLDLLDYRAYTYQLNTLSQYDGIVTNAMIHPESKVYDKFISRLGLSGSQVDRSFKKPYIYDRSTLDHALNQWLNRTLINKSNGHTLIKRYFTWDNEIKELPDKTEFYELGK